MANILIVDDDIVNSQLLVNKLTANGHSVTHATDGAAARMNVRNPFDFILLDLMMPKVDGTTLLGELRKGVNKKTPIVVFTNLMVEEKKQECLKLGANEVVLKVDITPSGMVEKIEGYVR